MSKPQTPKLCTCLVIALAISCAAPGSALAQAAMKVLVEPVVSGSFAELLPVSGNVASPQDSALATRISGSIIEIFVDVGDRVAAGDALLALDDKIARLDQQRLLATFTEAKHLHKDAQRLAEEATKLVQSRHISQTEYESRISQAAAAKSRVDQLQSQLAIQNELLDRHILKAPFSGVIAAKMTEAGQWVNQDTAVLRLAQMDPIYVELKLSERYFSQVQQGSPVRIHANNDPGLKIGSQVERIVPVSDPNSRTFLVRLTVANSNWDLIPGMSVRAEVSLSGSGSGDVLQVPADAIVHHADGKTEVWMVRPGPGPGEGGSEGGSKGGSIAEPLAVTVGRSQGSTVEVISSQLKAGDYVVTLGNESLQSGQLIFIDEPG